MKVILKNEFFENFTYDLQNKNNEINNKVNKLLKYYQEIFWWLDCKWKYKIGDKYEYVVYINEYEFNIPEEFI